MATAPSATTPQPTPSSQKNHPQPVPPSPPTSATAQVDDASIPFVGRWHELVTTTNWEKGRIISGWRRAQQQAGHEASSYSDETWAQIVGQVTSQHVGRLRRVFDRFGDSYQEYPNLYWSHFHAALEWDDAEIWLEGAIQGQWSIAQMKRAHDQAHGKGEAAAATPSVAASAGEGANGGELVEISDTDDRSVDGDHSSSHSSDTDGYGPASIHREEQDDATADNAPEGELQAAERNTAPKKRPFANLADLPEDLSEAFEQFKLAILHHKLSGWEKVSADEVLGVLDALRELALAPSE